MPPFNNNTSKLIAILIPAVSLFIIAVIIGLLLLICPIVAKRQQRKKKKLEVEKINQSLGTLISQTSSQTNSKQGSPLEKEEDTYHPEYIQIISDEDHTPQISQSSISAQPVQSKPVPIQSSTQEENNTYENIGYEVRKTLNHIRQSPHHSPRGRATYTGSAVPSRKKPDPNRIRKVQSTDDITRPVPPPSILSGTTQDMTKDAADHDHYKLTSHDSEIYTTPNTLPRRKDSNKGGTTDYLDEDDEYVDVSPRRASIPTSSSTSQKETFSMYWNFAYDAVEYPV